MTIRARLATARNENLNAAASREEPLNTFIQKA
jgi:hypothetical protein